MATPKLAVVTRVTKHTVDVREVEFEMRETEELGYISGKYVIVTTDVKKEDGKPVKRAYSIASPPLDRKRFSLCVKRIANGPASGFIHKLCVGDEVTFSGPWGKFLLPDPISVSQDFVFCASGTGLSAVMGHLVTLSENRNWRGTASFYWGLRKMSDLYCKERLEEISKTSGGRIHIEVFFSDEVGGKPLSRSFLDGDIPINPAALYYLAGNGLMISKIESKAEKSGVPEENIKKEIFFQ